MSSEHFSYHHNKPKYRPNPTREWTIQEDFAILPVVLACPSQIAYDASCRLLVDAFDRNHCHPPGTVLTTADKNRECRELIEGRIAHIVMDSHGEQDFSSWLLMGKRDELNLSWGEREIVLKQWVRRVLSYDEYLYQPTAILDRKTTSAGGFGEVKVSTYCMNCDLDRIESDEERPSPASPKNMQKVYGAVTDFLKASVDDEYAITTAWGKLHAVCRDLD